MIATSYGGTGFH
jgi:hypothetical protein